MQMFNVSGKFIIPGGKRETASFSGKVFAPSVQKGSKDLAGHLTELHGSKLPRGSKFSDNFALMHLKWEAATAELATKTKTGPGPGGVIVENVELPIKVEAEPEVHASKMAVLP